MTKYDAELIKRMVAADRYYREEVAKAGGKYVDPWLRTIEVAPDLGKRDAKPWWKSAYRLIAAGIAEPCPDERGVYHLAFAD